MIGQDGMFLFDVYFDFVFQVIGFQEIVDGCDIVIVLVFGGFLWFWFDQDCIVKIDFVFVFYDYVEELVELIEFLVDVGVEQGFIVFVFVLKYIVGIVEMMGYVYSVFYLGCCIGKNVWIGIGCSFCYEVVVGEYVGCVLEKFYVCFSYFFFKDICNGVYVGVVFG